MGHQQNLSGPFQSGTPNYHHLGQDQMMNGGRDDDMDGEFSNNKYYQEQRSLWEDNKDNSEGHQRARAYAQQTKAVPFGGPLGAHNDDTSMEDKVRASTAQTQNRNPWTELDLGGQGLKALSLNLYNYRFLTRLDIPHNHLREFPAAIGQLKNLEYLDVSFNALVSLPDEIGMLTNLKTLLLSGNRPLDALPSSIGYLYKLDTLGMFDTIYWENMPEAPREALLRTGTKGFVSEILESMPDDCELHSDLFDVTLLTLCQTSRLRVNESGTSSKKCRRPSPLLTS